MASNNELKEIGIKKCTFYFDDIISISDLNFDNVLLDEKSYKSFLIFHVLTKLHML